MNFMLHLFIIMQSHKAKNLGFTQWSKTQMHGTGTPQDLDKYIELKKGALV